MFERIKYFFNENVYGLHDTFEKYFSKLSTPNGKQYKALPFSFGPCCIIYTLFLLVSSFT